MRKFIRSEEGAVTVDWTVMTASVVGMGLAVGAVVSGGIEDLSNDIANTLTNVEISSSFRDLIGQVCHAAGVPDGSDGMTYNGMPVNALLIYQETDFISGLPDEARARAEGQAPFTLELSPDARPIVLFVADDDDDLHEVDNSQLIAQDVEINGETYGEGFDVSSAYTLSDSESGMMLSSLHFGDPWHGTRQGPVLATAASNPLEPGESYTFDGNQTTHRNERSYDEYLGCGA